MTPKEENKKIIAKNKRKKSIKNKAVSVLSAAVMALSGNSIGADAVSLDEIDYSQSYSDVVEKLRNSDDTEILSYIDFINNFEYNTNDKGSIDDLMLYTFGLGRLNWDNNCMLLGINKSYDEKLIQFQQNIKKIKSINMKDYGETTWAAFEGRAFGENSDNRLCEININNNSHYNYILFHEEQHTHQNLSINDFYYYDNNSKHHFIHSLESLLLYFMAEGDAEFEQSLIKEDFVENGFLTYKEIEGQTFGLISLIGFDEYRNYITNPNKKDTFYNFVKKRFEEQDLSEEYADKYLNLLCNSLVGTTYVSLRFDDRASSSSSFETSYYNTVDRYNEKPLETFEQNYEEMSEIVLKILKEKIKKTDDKYELSKLLKSIGMYCDFVLGNSYYRDNDNIKHIDDKRQDKKEKFINDYSKTIYDICKKGVISDFELPYDDFVVFLNSEDSLLKFINKISSYNVRYLYERENNVDDLRKKYGDLPNLVAISEFFNESNELFTDKLDINSISKLQNKGITPIYIGLGLVTGFDELKDYINVNEKNETFVDFVKRRFEEQGYTYKKGCYFCDSDEFLKLFSSTLINRFDHPVDYCNNLCKTSGRINYWTSYEDALNTLNIEENFQMFSSIGVYEIMKFKLNNAKTDDEKMKALEYMSIYLDYVCGNEIHYGENYSEVKNMNKKQDVAICFNGISESMYNMFDSIDGNDVIMSYDDFVDIYNRTGKATTYLGILENKNDNTLNKTDVLKGIKDYLNTIRGKYPNEKLYMFFVRYLSYVESGKISLEDANQIFNDIIVGKKSIDDVLKIMYDIDDEYFESIKSNNIELENKKTL